jgi:hypothetical protein
LKVPNSHSRKDGSFLLPLLLFLSKQKDAEEQILKELLAKKTLNEGQI